MPQRIAASLSAASASCGWCGRKLLAPRRLGPSNGDPARRQEWRENETAASMTW